MFNEVDELPPWQPSPTLNDIWDANFEQAQRQTTLFSIGRIMNANEANDVGKRLPPEQILKDFGIETSEPKTALWAQQQVDAREEEAQRQKVIESASGIWQKTVGFFGSLAGGASDPIDQAVGMALGAGISKVVAGVNPVQTLTTKIFSDLLGNIAANTASETVNVYASAKEEREISAKQSLANIALSSAAGTALSTIPHGLSIMLSKLGDVNHAKAYVATKNAVEAGVSPTAILSKVEAKLNEDFKIDPKFHSAVDVSIKNADAVAEIKKAETMPDAFNALEKQAMEGKVSPDEIIALKQSLKDSGFDERKYYMGGKDKEVLLSKEAVAEIHSEASKIENNSLYNVETREMLDTQKEIIPETVEEVKFKEVDAELKKIDKEVEELKIKDSADDLIEWRERTKKNLFDVYDGLVKCAYGALSGGQ